MDFFADTKYWTTATIKTILPYADMLKSRANYKTLKTFKIINNSSINTSASHLKVCTSQVRLSSDRFDCYPLASVAFHLRKEQADNISRSNWAIALAVSAFTDIYCLQKHGHNCFEHWESKNRGRDHLSLDLDSNICFKISKLPN